MLKKDLFNRKLKKDSFGHTGEPVHILTRPITLGIIAFTVLATLFSILIYQRYLIAKEAQKKEAYDIVNRVKIKLQEQLTYSLSATKILSFFINSNGQVENFDSVAAQIISATEGIDALELVPGGVIRYIYPLKGNERALGYDILKDPGRNKEALQAIEKKELFFSGPFELKQGGVGIVGRLPVFRNKKFWGFSAVVIKLPALLKAAGIDSSGGKGGYYIQLSKINPNTQKEEFFIHHKIEFREKHFISVDVPNGNWKLLARPVEAYRGMANIFILALLGFLISIFGGIFIFSEAGRPKRLDQLIKERTRELRESDERFSKAFHSNVLGLVIYDENFRIVDINEPYADLLGSSRNKLIGKTSDEAGLISRISEEKREAVSREIEDILNTEGQLRNYETEIVTSEGEMVSVLLSIEKLEMNNHIHWLASVIDITANKKAELSMKESEEKYRSLIEQASDGIVITNLDGIIIEVNNSLCLLSGYEEEEILGEQLYKFLPEADVTLNPLRFAELMQGKTLLHERRLLRKDGTVLDIEVNSKMASTHTLIGFIRDITGRKKNEGILLYQARLLDSVSDAVTSLDTNRCIVSWNQACEDLYGFIKEEVMGKRIPELVTFEFPSTTTEEVFKKVYSEGQWKGEFNFIHPKTNEKTYLLSSLNILKTPEGDITGIILTSTDITERKKAELARIHEEETRQMIMNSAMDAIVCINAAGAITLWNPQAEKTFGWSEEEIKGRLLADTIIPHQYREQHEEGLKYYSQTSAGPMLNRLIEINALDRQGREFPIELSIIPLKQDGELLFCAFIRDITERKSSVEEVGKSNERFELIAQATNDAVWDHDFSKNETWGNKKLFDLYGYEQGVEKINYEMFIDQIHPDERDRVVANMNNAIANSETSLSEEFRFKTADGKYRIFYDRAYIKYDETGKPLRILGAMQDITDREIIKKQILKEKELGDSIINSLPGVFYLFNQQGKFLRWNKNFETVTGYSSEEIEGMNPLDFFDESEKELLTRIIANVFIAGSDNVEAGFYLKDKTKIPYYFTGEAIEYEGETCLMGVGLDFSEKEKAAKAIRESEEKYRTMIEQASDGIFIGDSEAYFIDVNSAGCRMLGYTKEELYKIKFTSLIPGEDFDNNPVQYSKLATGMTVINERRLVKKDGSVIDVEISAKVLFDGRYQSIVRDITERKKAEQALRESEERYRALVENAPEALVVFDVEKEKFVSVSESATRLFKMSKEELLMTGPVAVSPEYQPDGRLSADAAKDNIRRTINGEKPSFEWEHCDKYGNRIPCEIWLVKLPSENEVLIRGSIVDITERKKTEEKIYQSEQKYRLLFYNNPLPMWMVTIPELKIIDVNEAAIKQYGYSRAEFLKLSTIDLRPAEDVENFLKEVDKMNPGVINERAWRHKKKDGTIIYVETYSHQVMYEGRLVWLGLSHDVTEKHHAKELLQKSYEDIRQLASNLQKIRENERTKIAREIHDELGQQLTGLKMDIHWLSRKIKDEEGELHYKIQESMELINTTITSVRKIATDLRPSILDDLGLIAALEWQGQEFEKRSGTKVKFINRVGDLQVTPEAATALFRIYQELLTNIARHAHAELVTASLYIYHETLYFSIKDDGEGFDAGGIGHKKTLGLLGIKERTTLIGGSYEIKTRPGEGAETIISIPVGLVRITV